MTRAKHETAPPTPDSQKTTEAKPMHPMETAILKSIQLHNEIVESDKSNFAELISLPLGTWSPEFYENPLVKQYSEEQKVSALNLRFRLALEAYLASDRASQYLENIEVALLQLPSPISAYEFKDPKLQSKATGAYLMPVSAELIRQIYQQEDTPLSHLIQKHFPTPSAQLFEGETVPDVIQKKEAAALETMRKIDIKTDEPPIVKLQRHVRMKKRHSEEVNRIGDQVKSFHLEYHPRHNTAADAAEGSSRTSEPILQSAEALLRDANTPYKPKCDPALSKRIMAAAKKIAAFSTVKHITSEKAIQSIFDGALYGRRTLLDFYYGFKPAALSVCDVLNGDANVACLGPQGIDPRADGGIIIEFDVPKLVENKPAAFYKQRDLEYWVSKIRQVKLGKDTLSFDHTGYPRAFFGKSEYGQAGITLQIFNAANKVIQFARAPKSSLIAYNLEKMHEILTLNFFRFMDNMADREGNLDQAYIDDFYHKVDRLTDEELLLFLTDLEKNMTDTAEFNFYGAHQIDFSTIINITARQKEYTLNLPNFINDLKQGNIDALRLARTNIPNLFRSYRFLDYLLPQVQDSDVKYYLDDLRKRCKTPVWVSYTPLIIPEGFELNWELQSKGDIHDQKPLI